MAVQTYCTYTTIKNRLELAVGDTSSDTLLTTIAGQVNGWLEGKIGFPVGPITSEIRLFDGEKVRWCSEHGGYSLPVYPWGVRAVTVVRTSTDDGATFTSRTASDVVIRPHTFERETDWPGFELHIKNTASWSWEAGFDANEITATWGWAAIPDELKSIAERLGVAAYRARGAGSGRQYAIAEDGADTFAEEMSATDWRTIGKYQNLRAPVG
jgi:hypothetical protein